MNVVSRTGRTPLHDAAVRARVESIEVDMNIDASEDLCRFCLKGVPQRLQRTEMAIPLSMSSVITPFLIAARSSEALWRTFSDLSSRSFVVTTYV